MSAELPERWASKGPLVRLYASSCTEADEPDLSAFLGRHPETTSRERADVILFDQWHRWRNGRGVSAEFYLNTFPDLAADPGFRLELVCAEIVYRQERGEEPALEAFAGRFPDLADPLSEMLRPEAPSAGRGGALTDAVRRKVTNLSTRWSSGGGEETKYLTLFDERAPTQLNRRTVTLPPHVIGLLRAHMTTRHFPPGEFLMRQGEPGDALLVVTAGEVEISTVAPGGERTVITRSAGSQVLGEMALLTQQPRSADVSAVTPVQALVLAADKFHELARQHPVISHVLTQLIAQRLGQPGRDDVLSGKTLDGYRVVRRLGRGGMAVVYEAEEVAAGRRVALKMMSHRLVYDEAARDQFQREAEIIRAFDHPNIVRVFGRFAAFHTYFIVMEFCDGLTLEQIIRRRGPLPEEPARRIIGQVAAALRYAHDAGIIHRDVKPSNVILTREGRALLMDFGLAKPVESKSNFDELIVGTPRYMAPEQLRGREVGYAVDLFALGCVLFEMLAGAPLVPESQMSRVIRSHSRWETPNFDADLPTLQPSTRQLLAACLRLDAAERRVDLAEVAGWAGDVVLP